MKRVSEGKSELVVSGVMSLPQVSKAFYMSRMFKDVANEAQATVKILAGRELGLGPFASMRLLQIIQGNVQASGHGIASLIGKSEIHDYTVDRLDEKGCTVSFYSGGKVKSGREVLRGTFTFTEEDAIKAGLFKSDTYKKYPRDMYFNRAISAGYKKFIPEVTMGVAVYVEGELGEGEVQEKKEVVDVEFTVVSSAVRLEKVLSSLNMTADEVKKKLGLEGGVDLFEEEVAKKVLVKLAPLLNLENRNE